MNIPDLDYDQVKENRILLKGKNYIRYSYREKLDKILPEFIYYSYFDDDDKIFIDTDELNDILETTYQRRKKLEQLETVNNG